MTKNRFGKMMFLSFLIILCGFFLFSCEKPGRGLQETQTG